MGQTVANTGQTSSAAYEIYLGSGSNILYRMEP